MPVFKRPSRWLLAFSLLLLSTSCLNLHAQRSIVEDEEFGYAVRPMQGWTAVDIPPRETWVIRKWAHPRTIQGFESTFEVLVFDKKTKAIKPEDFREGGLDRFELQRRLGPKNYDEWLEGRLAGTPVWKRERKMRIKKPEDLTATAVLKEGTLTQPSMWQGQPPAVWGIMAIVVDSPHRQWAVQVTTSADQMKRRRNHYFARLKSFMLLESAKPKPVEEEKPAGAAGAAGSVEGKKDDGYARTESFETRFAKAAAEAEARAKRSCDRVKGMWYHTSPSKRYIILTNTKKSNKAKIRRVARVLEASRDLFEKEFPPASPITAVSIVRVFRDAGEYRKYGAPAGSAGYWSASEKELALYLEGQVDFTMAVLRHEAFHQYIFYSVGDFSPHSWYNEGTGDYYAGAKVSGKRIVGVGPFGARVDTIRRAVREESFVPLEEFVRYTQQQYYANPQLCYAQGWSLIYFLRKGVADSHAWSKILPTYFDTMKSSKDLEAAVSKAFEGVDIEKLQTAWKAFVLDNNRRVR